MVSARAPTWQSHRSWERGGRGGVGVAGLAVRKLASNGVVHALPRPAAARERAGSARSQQAGGQKSCGAQPICCLSPPPPPTLTHAPAEVHRGVIEVFARGVEVSAGRTPA